MALTRRLALFFVIIALMPFWAGAQQDDAALREAIRADIMNDPRSSSMTEAEVEAMVDALAVEAQEQGAASDYLEARSSTFNTPEIPVYDPPLLTTSNALAIAALALLLVLGGVATFLIRNRRKAQPTE
ncbi:hypothetical protein JNK62_01405 [bacterium]|nr:hypothetical protein [bacterium]